MNEWLVPSAIALGVLLVLGAGVLALSAQLRLWLVRRRPR
jgi:hypothetical protein